MTIEEKILNEVKEIIRSVDWSKFSLSDFQQAYDEMIKDKEYDAAKECVEIAKIMGFEIKEV